MDVGFVMSALVMAAKSSSEVQWVPSIASAVVMVIVSGVALYVLRYGKPRRLSSNRKPRGKAKPIPGVKMGYQPAPKKRPRK